MEVLKKDNNEESRMVLYTLTIPKLWDGKKSGVGFNGNQCDAPDITEHPWNHALFVICKKKNNVSSMGQSCSSNKVEQEVPTPAAAPLETKGKRRGCKGTGWGGGVIIKY